MATSNLRLLLLAFSLLTISAAARPCKTLFFITTSTSYYHIPHNPNLSPNFPRSRAFFFTTRSNRPDPFFFRRRDPVTFHRGDAAEQVVEEGGSYGASILFGRPDPVFIRRSDPVELYSSAVTSSVSDRTKDIMSVVGALLFGVGCGALTAATMYLIWSLFWPNNRFEFEDFEDSDDDDDISPKKMGYVAIPATKVVDDDNLKKPAKEVV